MEFETLSINAVGTTVSATTSASAAFAIPLAANGQTARFVRIQADGLVHVAFGPTTSVTATASYPLYNANFDRVMNVRGNSWFSVLSRVGTVALNMTPVEG